MGASPFDPPTSERAGRESLVRLGRLLYERGLVAATDGNFSIRLPDKRILITPAGRPKGYLQPEEILLLDGGGEVLRAHGGLQPSSESPMHLEAYRLRPAVNAVIHAHPPYALALTVAGRSLPNDVLAELPMTLGEVPTLPFSPPSSEAGASAIREAIREHDALLLKNHGSLTVGDSLGQALIALERVEAVAQVIFLAELLGGTDRLSTEQIGQVLDPDRST